MDYIFMVNEHRTGKAIIDTYPSSFFLPGGSTASAGAS